MTVITTCNNFITNCDVCYKISKLVSISGYEITVCAYYLFIAALPHKS